MAVRRLGQAAQEVVGLLSRRQPSLGAGCSIAFVPCRCAPLAKNGLCAVPSTGSQVCWSRQQLPAQSFSSTVCSVDKQSGAAPCGSSRGREYHSAALGSTPLFCSRRGSWPQPTCWPRQAAVLQCVRGFPATSKLRPVFRGGKMKVYSRYKERFKLTATGKVLFFRPGHRHKRWAKTSKQLRNLRKSVTMHDTYAHTMKKLGFKMTTF